MSLRTLISLMTAFIMLSSGKCEKDIENTSMEGYIFEGKSFLSKVYFDPNRENAVVEIQVGKFNWETREDAEYFQEGKFQADYIPNFLKNYQEALKNRN